MLRPNLWTREDTGESLLPRPSPSSHSFYSSVNTYIIFRLIYSLKTLASSCWDRIKSHLHFMLKPNIVYSASLIYCPSCTVWSWVGWCNLGFENQVSGIILIWVCFKQIGFHWPRCINLRDKLRHISSLDNHQILLQKNTWKT